MTKNLTGRTALVTGGGIGIGRAIARALAADGARVALTYLSHAPEPELLSELEMLSGFAPFAVRLDATAESAVIEAVGLLTSELGSIDILVNNIGGLIRRSPIRDMPFELWKEVMAVNLDSMFLVTHHILPLITAPGGRIINVASLAGRNGGHPGAVAYATSKAAIFGFTRGLATEIGPDGITVNALAPGFIEATPFHDTFTSAESKAATITKIPAGRAGTPDDVASAAVWLASAGTGFISGTVIDVNGAAYFG